MIAAVVRASNIVGLNAVKKAIETFEYFNPRIAQLNIQVVEEAYKGVKTE
jgi:Pyruvate/2-oxoacid:ferredoxin oxidoreductase gamma subunit